MITSPAIIIAILIDVCFGWPDWLYKRVGHPVAWLGTFIKFVDQTGNKDHFSPIRKLITGFFLVIFIISLLICISIAIEYLLPNSAVGIIIKGIIISPFLAIRSLYQHILEVHNTLKCRQLLEARVAVSKVVGRDTDDLDENGVARAALESLAENTSDAIVSPVFWSVLFGMPGIVVYKAINTLDSMIGYKTDKYRYFGFASAKVDDFMNIIPSRLTGIIFCLTSKNPFNTLMMMFKQANQHSSPNAGWPESAMAYALDVRLSGPRSYRGKQTEDSWFNENGRNPNETHIKVALSKYIVVVISLSCLVIFLSANLYIK